MVSGRRGHSLAELVVAMAILGASLAGMAAVPVVGSRRAGEAVLLQRAVTLAGEVLDSLAALGDAPTSGRRDPAAPGLVAEWEVRARAAGSSTVLVRVHRATAADTIATLDGLWIPAPPGPIP